MKKTLALLLSVLILTGAGCITQTSQNPVACTAEAKQCPDGSFVGRTGPNCEFTACPQTNTSTARADWKTIEIGGIVSFQIPPNCNPDSGAGSTYIVCPTSGNQSPDPEFVFSSDGIQVNVRRWKNTKSLYWNDTISSLKVIQPLTHGIQINIDK